MGLATFSVERIGGASSIVTNAVSVLFVVRHTAWSATYGKQGENGL
jgi:hypothetical protein